MFEILVNDPLLVWNQASSFSLVKSKSLTCVINCCFKYSIEHWNSSSVDWLLFNSGLYRKTSLINSDDTGVGSLDLFPNLRSAEVK